MSDEIKRKVELWLCAEMRHAIPGSRAVPSKGGDEANSSDEPEPPFTYVKVTECDEVDDRIYQVTVKIARVSHIVETTSAQHSAHVAQFHEVLRGLVGVRGVYEPLQLAISGLVFASKKSNEEISDEEEEAHGDVFTMVAGVAG